MCWSELQNDHFKSGCFAVVVELSSVAKKSEALFSPLSFSLSHSVFL